MKKLRSLKQGLVALLIAAMLMSNIGVASVSAAQTGTETMEEGQPKAPDASEEQTAPDAEDEQRPSEEETLPSEEETLPSEEEAPPSEEETPPSEEEAPPSEEETPPSEEEAPPSEEEMPPSEEETPPADTEEQPDDEEPGDDVINQDAVNGELLDGEIPEGSVTTEIELDEDATEMITEKLMDNVLIEDDLDYVLGRPMTPEEEEEQKRLIKEYVSMLVPLVPDEEVESVLDYSEPMARAGALESKYDSRTSNCITSVKNQNPYGSCWAFSTINSAEASLIKQGLASVGSVDLSERHLVYYNYRSVCDPLGGTAGDSNLHSGSVKDIFNAGGNYSHSSRILAMWMGAANESAAPYGQASTALPDTKESAYGQNSAILKNVYGINKKDASLVKQAIKDHGAVGIMYCALDGYSNYYNTQTAAEYCDTYMPVNHAVSVVGWDDNYSVNNFATKPSKPGAWLVKNSWGDWFGKDGYFWLSYEDATINSSFYVFEMQPGNLYDNNYQYDGSALDAWFLGNSSVQIANVFTAHANYGKKESLKAVGFASGAANCNYSIQIYKNPTRSDDPTSGTALLSTPKTGQAAYEGYYTVPLGQEVKIADGDQFAVVVTLSKPGSDIKVMVETSGNYAGSYSTASAAAGQSFFRQSSSGGWYDVGSSNNVNVRVKAFTSNVNENSDGIPVTGITLKEKTATVSIGGTKQLTATVTPANATNKMVSWTSSDNSVATVDANGVVKGVKDGKAVITASAGGGKYKAECSVTVQEGYTNVVISGWRTLGTVGNTYQFTAKVYPLNMPDRTVTWSSSDTSVAKVDKNGKVTAMGTGTAVIKAAANGDKSVVGTYEVTVPVTQMNLIKSFVTRMYTNVLMRDPEPNGLNDWSLQLVGKIADGSRLAQGFIGSVEFKNKKVSNNTYVEILYKTFFNRAADSSGKKYWLNLLENGMSREYILRGFVNSDEFQKLCDSYGIDRGEMKLTANRDQNEGLTMFINRIYVKALGRPGEEAGIEDWTGRILRKEETPESTAKKFFFSQEFANKKLNDTEYVKVLYRTFMGREYDQAGLNDWVGRLAKGTSREKVLEGFSKSTEFANIMKSYGL